MRHGRETFVFSKTTRPSLGPTDPTIQRARRFFPGDKEADALMSGVISRLSTCLQVMKHINVYIQDGHNIPISSAISKSLNSLACTSRFCIVTSSVICKFRKYCELWQKQDWDEMKLQQKSLNDVSQFESLIYNNIYLVLTETKYKCIHWINLAHNGENDN